MGIFSQPSTMRENLLLGSLVHVGEKKLDKPRIRVFDYNNERLEEKEIDEIEQVVPYMTREDSVTWVNIDGLHDVSLFEKINKFLNIHSLVLEDALNPAQRPKYEDFGDYIFVVMKTIELDKPSLELKIEQISLILGANYVITFQERVGRYFESVRDRLRGSKGRIRRQGADYLAYALMDAIVDDYYEIPEMLDEIIGSVEASVLSDPAPKDLESIYSLKRQVALLEKTLWPLREVVNSLRREETELISDAIKPFLQDLYDHVIQLIDTVHTFRDVLSSLQDLYLSTMSNRMNDVMKVLTIIATIFIPLTFIAGIYGMNFEFMPELKIKYGYFIALFAMVAVAGAMAVYFRRKRWL